MKEPKYFKFSEKDKKEAKELANTINMVLDKTPIKKITYEKVLDPDSPQDEFYKIQHSIVTIERVGADTLTFKYKDKPRKK